MADRMTATEKEWLVRMAIAEQIMDNNEPRVKKRIEQVAHGRLMLNGARGLLKRFLRDVEATLNDSDRRVLARSFSDTSYTIGIRCKATKGNKAKLENDYCIVVPMASINALLAACHEHCITCFGSQDEAKSCALRKAIDAIPNDTPDLPGGECPYKDALGEDDENG